MKKIYTVIALLFLISNVQAQFTSSQTGNWDVGTTWGGVCSSGCTAGVDYPGATDNATIIEGTTVTIPNGNAESCANLTIGDQSYSGQAAQLWVGNTAAAILTVNGNLSLGQTDAISITMNVRSTSTVNIAGNIIFTPDLDPTRVRIITSAGASTVNMSGTLDTDGRVLGGSNGSTWNFKSSIVTQVIPTFTNYAYDNITCNNTSSGGVTLSANATASNFGGNFTVQSGSFNNAGFSIDGSALKNFQVDADATFKLSGTSVLPTTIQHVLAATSTVEFAGGSQTIGIPNNGQDYGNLTISGTGTKSLGGGANRNVVGALTVSSSTLALGTGADVITLVSDASGTASLANITGTITGTQLTVQRYVATALSDANWRELSSPLTGRTIADWNDDITTSGFTGADGNAMGFISIYSYDESASGSSSNGWTAVTDVTNSVSSGVGFLAWIQETSPITISVTGAPNSGAVALPITYNNDTVADHVGWNLLGNPFASAIDWTNLTRSGIEDGYWILDPTSGNYGSWNETTTTGTLGANGNIGHSQAFWAHATATPTLSVPQSAKTTEAAGIFFKQKSGGNSLTLNLSSSINSYYDEAIIRTDINATDDFDIYDNQKFFTANPWEVPSLSILSSDQIDLAISSIADLGLGDSITIPLRVKVGITGIYTIKIDGYSTFNFDSDIVLEDLLTSTTTEIKTNNTYSFSIEDTTSEPRFLLHIKQSTTPAGIADELDSRVNVQVYPNPFETTTTFKLQGELVTQPNSDIQFMLYDQIGRLVEEAKIKGEVYVFDRKNLDSGVYFYKIISKEGNTLISSGKLAIQ